jgi:hypothetical protein
VYEATRALCSSIRIFHHDVSINHFFATRAHLISSPPQSEALGRQIQNNIIHTITITINGLWGFL